MSRGRFIVLEGPDGVGTTTQRSLITKRLQAQGRNVHETAEPSTGPIGLMIRKMLKETSSDGMQHRRQLALMFAADRLYHYTNEVEVALASGKDVVSDRYLLSSIVYQSMDLPLEWVVMLNTFAPKADVTLVLWLPLDIALERIMKRSDLDIFETRAVQEVVHAKYAMHAPDVNGHVVDANGNPDEVTERIMKVLVTMDSVEARNL